MTRVPVDQTGFYEMGWSTKLGSTKWGGRPNWGQVDQMGIDQMGVDQIVPHALRTSPSTSSSSTTSFSRPEANPTSFGCHPWEYFCPQTGCLSFKEKCEGVCGAPNYRECGTGCVLKGSRCNNEGKQQQQQKKNGNESLQILIILVTVSISSLVILLLCVCFACAKKAKKRRLQRKKSQAMEGVVGPLTSSSMQQDEPLALRNWRMSFTQ